MAKLKVKSQKITSGAKFIMFTVEVIYSTYSTPFCNLICESNSLNQVKASH